jgi:hypothetical protein
MDSLGLKVLVTSLSAQAQLLLWYSVRIRSQYLPNSEARLLPRNAIAAQYPFIRALMEPNQAYLATAEIRTTLHQELTDVDTNQYPEISKELEHVVSNLSLNLIEKRLDDAVARCRLEVFHIADDCRQRGAGEDSIFLKFLERLRWKRETAGKKATDWPQKLIRISKAFAVAQNEPWNLNHGTQELAELVAAEVGFEPEHRHKSERVLYRCDPILPNRNVNFHFCYWSSEILPERQLERLKIDTERMSTIHVVILTGYSILTPRQHRDFLEANVVIIRPADIVRHFLTPDTASSLRTVLMSQLKLSLLSPYQFAGPTRVFLGRKQEMSRIIQDHEAHFCVVGPRKIGKTSLQERLARECDGAWNVVVKVESSTSSMRLVHFQQTLLNEFRRALTIRGIERDLSMVWTGDEFFPQLQQVISDLSRTGYRVVFLIDEVDDVLRISQIYAFESFCRTLGNRRHARFIVFGFTVFAQRINDRKSAFHNFFQEIILGPLDEISAQELVRNPMSDMNVDVPNEVVKGIVEKCGRMPHLIQAMCSLLIKRECVELQRRITLSDVEWAYSHDEFNNVLLQPLTLDDSMKDLVLLVAQGIGSSAALGYCSDADFFEFFAKRLPQISTGEITRSLNHLCSTYVLKTNGGIYRFFVEEQRRRLPELWNIPEHIEQIVSSLQRNSRYSG